MTLTNRLLLFFLSTLAVVLIGFSVTLYLAADTYLHRQLEERLDYVLDTICRVVEDGPDGLEWEPDHQDLTFDFSLMRDQAVWLVTDERGTVIEQSQSPSIDSFLSDTSPSLVVNRGSSNELTWSGAQFQASQRRIHSNLRRKESTGDSDGSPRSDGSRYTRLCVTAGISRRPLNNTMRWLLNVLVWLSAGTWLAALFAGRSICRGALRPVRNMADSAGQIDANDLAWQRLPAIKTHDELGELNSAFNSLLDRLQEAFERQRRFTGDASHQLRTPLTAILGQIEVALRRNRPPEEYRQTLVTVQKRATHLAQMVEALLFLTRGDSDTQTPQVESIELADWLRQHVQTWSGHDRSRDLRFESAISKPCLIHAQPALLRELLNILLDNASKFSMAGTEITIRLEMTETTALIKVEDHGIGIEPSEIDSIFSPFWRSEEARRHGIDGMGLGLSIARRLTNLFQGDLSVVSSKGDGSTFAIKLPIAVQE